MGTMKLKTTKAPISVSDILAVTDAAGFSIPWVKGLITIRALTIREFLYLADKHPGLTNLIDRRMPMTTIPEIISALGRPAMIAVLVLAMKASAWRLRLLPDVALVHAIQGVTDVTFGNRLIDDFFLEERKPGKDSPSRRDPAKTKLLQIVRDASEYTVRTGRDALDMSPLRLAFAIRSMAEVDHKARSDMFTAFAAAQGDKTAFVRLGEI